MGKTHSKYQELEAEVSNIKQATAQNKARAEEAQCSFEESKAEIARLEDELKAAAMADKRVTVEKIEALLDGHQKVLRRAELLMQGLSDELPVLEARLADAEAQRTALFEKAARKWLENQIGPLDDAADAYRLQLRRVFACTNELTKRGLRSVASDVLGSSLSFLAVARIPRIRNLDKSNFTKGSTAVELRPSHEVIRQVLDEITGT